VPAVAARLCVRVPSAVAARRRAASPLTPLGAGAVLLAALVCLLHVLCGATAQGAERPPDAVPGVVAVGGHVPDAGPHHHPASLTRRVSPHAGPQHRALPPFGASRAGIRPRQEPAGSLRAGHPGIAPPAGSALPHTVLRC
jgi:hypothetical protein